MGLPIADNVCTDVRMIGSMIDPSVNSFFSAFPHLQQVLGAKDVSATVFWFEVRFTNSFLVAGLVAVWSRFQHNDRPQTVTLYLSCVHPVLH